MINFISRKVVLSNTKSMAVNRLLDYYSYPLLEFWASLPRRGRGRRLPPTLIVLKQYHVGEKG
jgi:hypothetical protein